MARTGSLLSWLRTHAVPLGSVLVGLVASALVIAGVAQGWAPLASHPYDVYAFVSLAWVCSAVSLAAKRIPRFALVHALRAIFLASSLFSFAARHLAIALLLAVPFVLDSALHLRTRSALVVSAAAMLVLLLGTVGAPAAAPTGKVLLDAVTCVLLVGVTALVGMLVSRYRERMVAMSAREEQLKLSLISLEQANRSYQEYAEKVEHLSEDKERHRITREIHDTIGYALTNIGMLLQAGKAIAAKDPDRLHELLDAARDQANAALQESRNILYKLRAARSAAVQGLGSIHRLAKSLKEATGIEVEVSSGNAPWSFGAPVDSAIFRLVEEGITNAIKHGMARRIRISYWLTSDELQVRIWDDGKGSATVAEGIGIKGMRERFAGLGGRIEASNVVDGFVLAAYVPVGAVELEDSGV